MSSKERLLISACLVGDNVKYDGTNNLMSEDILNNLSEKYELVPICPEVLGGMTVPRVPCEITSLQPLEIKNEFGIDMKDHFISGENEVLYYVGKFSIKYALLKSNSPSCGNEYIYDGNFNGTLVKGQGITANILSSNGVKVYNENQIEELI